MESDLARSITRGALVQQACSNKWTSSMAKSVSYDSHHLLYTDPTETQYKYTLRTEKRLKFTYHHLVLEERGNKKQTVDRRAFFYYTGLLMLRNLLPATITKDNRLNRKTKGQK